MKQKWFSLYNVYDDAKRYLDDDIFKEYYCQNPKCYRLLTACPAKNKLSKIKKLRADFVLLSAMNIHLCSDDFLALIAFHAKNDISFDVINPNVNLLRIDSTCELNEELIDEGPLCPQCGMPLWRISQRASEGEKTRMFKNSDNETSLICRSKITMKDSSRATYRMFARDILVDELKKIKNFKKCIHFYECIPANSDTAAWGNAQSD